MKENCFDESTIQAFLDGELSSDMLENVARHVTICDDCALLLTEAEDESMFAFDLLGEEFNTLVPTERIRANVYQAISEIEKPRVSFWQKVLGFNYLANPSIVAFASLLMIFGVFATVLSLRETKVSDDKAATTEKLTPKADNVIPTPSGTPSIIVASEKNKMNTAPKVQRVVYKPEPKPTAQNIEVQSPKSKVQSPKSKTEDQKPKTAPLNLEGEDTYLKTIATLETNVNANKDVILRASSRVSYERDMAVVDESIKRMKEEVRKNPKNEAAKQILRNSYQNKIELLNSVNERSELIAAR